MNIKAIKTRVFKEDEDLFLFITRYIKNLREESVVVVTSKIVSLSERRTAPQDNVKTKIELMYAESSFVMPTKHVWLTVKDGMVMSSAGIDESNSENGKFILLPKDSYKTARWLRKKLMQRFKLKKLGVLITDSRSIPLRIGAMGVAMGYAGFCGLRDYRGKSDIFGKKFKYSRANIGDSLAAAAVLAMGEGMEQRPIALVTDAPVEFRNKINKEELKISIQEDLYRPIYLNPPNL